MNLIVTGGAGFLGNHICNKLSEKYDKVFVVDVAPINPDEYSKNVEYFKVDIRDFEAFDNIISTSDHIIHTAAALPLWKREDIFSTNVTGTRNILEAALLKEIKRVVYVSSTAVYGIPKIHPIYEDAPFVGVGPYGESKIEAEKICEEYRQKGMCVPVVRPKTFIGTTRLGVFHILYDWVYSGKRIPLIGSGKNRYQLLEVEDLVDSIDLMLTLPEDKTNDTFNIGAKEFTTTYEDVEAMCKFAGTKARPWPIPSLLVKPLLELFWILKISPLYKWVYGTADKDSFVSIEKAEKKLNWSPKYSNADALIRSYKWFLEHKDEIKDSGDTHRVAWKQGILSLFKKFL